MTNIVIPYIDNAVIQERLVVTNRVAHHILLRKYKICDGAGYEISLPVSIDPRLGILKERPPVQKWGGLSSKRQDAHFIGVVNFKEDIFAHDDKPYDRWFVKVFGDEFEAEMRGLIDGVSRSFVSRPTVSYEVLPERKFQRYPESRSDETM